MYDPVTGLVTAQNNSSLSRSLGLVITFSCFWMAACSSPLVGSWYICNSIGMHTIKMHDRYIKEDRFSIFPDCGPVLFDIYYVLCKQTPYYELVGLVEYLLYLLLC